ncbi:hypothetical protein [Bartonella sp. A05]|uniref:hypothetical protein n=1 Tax=Bartonella sp. A05 TaxID=2967261 RepID=UPI0022A95F16|nr:hypothetical protein [Bartonella sp. A05]MCZ2204017.1 hypothetical protein [Bartonella sp. A05]
MANNQPRITISKYQLINLINNIGQKNICCYFRSPHQTYCEISLEFSSASFSLYVLQSVFARDDRDGFPLFSCDEFNRWFLSVSIQALTVWLNNCSSDDFLAFDRLSELIVLMALVKAELDDLRYKLIQKRKEEIKLIDNECSMSEE